MRTLVSRAIAAPDWPFQLLRYLCIGGFTFCVDIGTLTLLLWARQPLFVAVSAAYVLAVGVHFSLNKYVNFRAHDRALGSQLGNYAMVAFACWLTTLAIVFAGVTAFGVAPQLAKIVAVVVNFPIAFLGHRYFTFGAGIETWMRRLLARRPQL